MIKRIVATLLATATLTLGAAAVAAPSQAMDTSWGSSIRAR